jgi:hypothetical protein
MPYLPPLIALHVLLTTLGFAGLLATNVWLMLLFRVGEGAALELALRASRHSIQIFGPTLGLGILAGFALALVMGMPLAAAWLVGTYALIVLVLGVQAAVMVPWQIRASAALERGEKISTRAVAIVLSIACFAYVAIISLMVIRP